MGAYLIVSYLCMVPTVGYTMRDIRYKWNEGPNSVGVSSEVSLPQFKVLGHRQRAMEISLTTGNYSRLACEIQFVRSMGYYLIQIYIPSGLIVIISWVSFWLNRNATPARVSLGVTTVLTMTTLMSSTNAALPKISYVKSIDVYLGTCFVMVFASLLEVAGPSEPVPPPRTSTLNRSLRGPIPMGLNKLLGITPSDIDKYSRIVFPVCFVCFNLTYWVIYLHVSDVVADDLVLLGGES
ncbi:GABA receptor [Operophtera brumata]|uniref:GABA receptor n=1 Tax=Operophtera brumata TaxID=104452 RepID=A0A0L7LUW1_OPEBR|nr:GABA receptor [Operophtera brumata]